MAPPEEGKKGGEAKAEAAKEDQPKQGELKVTDLDLEMEEDELVVDTSLHQIASGFNHNLALSDNGHIYVWGSNEFGQLGIGDKMVSSLNIPSHLDFLDENEKLIDKEGVPLPVRLEGQVHVAQVAAGANSSFALTTSGVLLSWGKGGQCQLGHGDSRRVDELSPQIIKGLKSKIIVSISCGPSHAVAVSDLGNCFTWGNGAYGALGHGDNQESNEPRAVQSLYGHKIRVGKAGSKMTAVLTENGRVFTWGYNGDGRLGHGDMQGSLVPKEVETGMPTRVVDLAVGDNHCLALTEKMTVFSWGNGEFGKLGCGEVANALGPRHIRTLDDRHIVRIAASAFASFAISSNGELHSWGGGRYYKTGHASEKNHLRPAMVSLLQGVRSFEVAPGPFHTCVVTETGDLITFGFGGEGRLGHNNNDMQERPSAVATMKGVLGYRLLSSIKAISLLKDRTGQKVKSGNVSAMQSHIVRNKEKLGRAALKKVVGAEDSLLRRTFVRIAAAERHSMAINEGGSLFVWGNNDSGRLGIGNFSSVPKPEVIVTLLRNPVVEVVSHSAHSMCLTDDGDLYIWGKGSDRRMGIDDEDQALPMKINLMDYDIRNPIASLAVGETHSMICTDIGELYTWGLGHYGKLGTGDCNDQMAPTQIAMAYPIVGVAAGSLHSVCLDDSGHCYSFGSGWDGKLGLGDNSNQFRPRKVKDLLGITRITCGPFHTLAVNSKGQIYAWGKGKGGRLGTGDSRDQSSPKHLATLSAEFVVDISAGEQHSGCVTEKGTMYTWGRNNYGQLGHGDTRDNTVPTKVAFFGTTKVAQLACGGHHTLALTEDLVVYTMGSNSHGRGGVNKAGGDFLKPKKILQEERTLDDKEEEDGSELHDQLGIGEDNEADFGISIQELHRVVHAESLEVETVLKQGKDEKGDLEKVMSETLHGMAALEDSVRSKEEKISLLIENKMVVEGMLSALKKGESGVGDYQTKILARGQKASQEDHRFVDEEEQALARAFPYQPYSKFLGILKERPRYLVSLGKYVHPNSIDPLVDNLFKWIFGTKANDSIDVVTREENLLLNLIHMAIKEEVMLSPNINAVLNDPSKGFATALLRRYSQREDCQHAVKVTLAGVFEALDPSQIYEVDVMKVYDDLLKSDQGTVTKYADYSKQIALEDEDVKRTLKKRFPELISASERIIARIIESEPDIPSGAKRISNFLLFTLKDRYPVAPMSDIVTVVARFLYGMLFKEALIHPDKYGVKNKQLRKNILTVSEVLNGVANCREFESSSTYSPVNPLLQKFSASFEQWVERVAKSREERSTKIEAFLANVRASTMRVTMPANLLVYLHSDFNEHLVQVAPQGDPLREHLATIKLDMSFSSLEKPVTFVIERDEVKDKDGETGESTIEEKRKQDASDHISDDVFKSTAFLLRKTLQAVEHLPLSLQGSTEEILTELQQIELDHSRLDSAALLGQCLAHLKELEKQGLITQSIGGEGSELVQRDKFFNVLKEVQDEIHERSLTSANLEEELNVARSVLEDLNKEKDKLAEREEVFAEAYFNVKKTVMLDPRIIRSQDWVGGHQTYSFKWLRRHGIVRRESIPPDLYSRGEITFSSDEPAKFLLTVHAKTFTYMIHSVALESLLDLRRSSVNHYAVGEYSFDVTKFINFLNLVFFKKRLVKRAFQKTVRDKGQRAVEEI